jgi:fatty acid desaturase
MKAMQAAIRRPPDSRDEWRDAYRALRHAVRAAGLFERTYGYYAAVGAASVALLAAGVAIPFALPRTLGADLLTVVLLTVGIVQCCLLGHDGGHGAIFHRSGPNRLVGQLGWSLIGGVGFWYWNDRHNRHHGRANDVRDDPDLAPGLLDRLFGRYPLIVTTLSLFLSPFVFRAEGCAYTVRALHGMRRMHELLLLTVNVLLWGSFFVLLSWRGVGLFLVSHITISLYMVAAIAPNHRGMPLWAHGVELSFLQRQVLSSRNLSTNPAYDLLYGGLNSQIEHHLFPTMPRPHLRRARALVAPFCAACDLAYEAMPLCVAYRQVVLAVAYGESLASMME